MENKIIAHKMNHTAAAHRNNRLDKLQKQLYRLVDHISNVDINKNVKIKKQAIAIIMKLPEERLPGFIKKSFNKLESFSWNGACMKDLCLLAVSLIKKCPESQRASLVERAINILPWDINTATGSDLYCLRSNIRDKVIGLIELCPIEKRLGLSKAALEIVTDHYQRIKAEKLIRKYTKLPE